MYYAGHAILTCGYGKGSFFVTPGGSLRHQGIAEQVGRIMYAELATEEEAKELLKQAIEDYENGESVKEIERRLRLLRLSFQTAKK